LALITRRHVFYVEGYDPRGAAGYHRIFGREWALFRKVWGLGGHLGELAIDSDMLAHWDVDTAGPNWQVATRYEFLRLEPFIGASMREPLIRQIPRALAWTLDDLATGTLFRIFRAAWRFGVHLVLPQILLLGWLALALAGAVLAAVAATRFVDLPALLAAVIGLAAGAAIFAALRPLADRWFVVQLNVCWPNLRALGRGAPTGFDHPIEACAQRLVAVARAAQVDEIVVVGHSAGGAISPLVMARALELDPDLGRHGPRLVLLTVASLMPAVALHPAAVGLRGAIRRLASEPSVLWIDCQARKDIMNFWDFDPVAGIGVVAGAERCNPTIWIVRLRDMLTDDAYRRLRFSYFRMHYQFVMGNNRRAPYDYFLLVCGPVSFADWAEHEVQVFESFGPDAALLDARIASPVPT
jgi:hypothetical protein